MEKDYLTNSTLYSHEEINDIIFLYQQILNILIRELPNFTDDFNIKGGFRIIGVKRGVIIGSKHISWDYLSATHSTIEGELLQDKNENSIRFVEIILSSGKTLIFSTISSPDKGMINLDDYYNHLSDKARMLFDENKMELNGIESKHFQSESYEEKFNEILKSSKDDLAKALNIQQKI